MSKVLVAYFSASGVTAKLAERLAKAIGADLYAELNNDDYKYATVASQADMDAF